jgi:hypothetical protein
MSRFLEVGSDVPCVRNAVVIVSHYNTSSENTVYAGITTCVLHFLQKVSAEFCDHGLQSVPGLFYNAVRFINGVHRSRFHALADTTAFLLCVHSESRSLDQDNLL